MTRALGWTLALLLAAALAADPAAARPEEGKERGPAKEAAHAAHADKHESNAPRGALQSNTGQPEPRRDNPQPPTVAPSPPALGAPVAAPPVASPPVAVPPAAAPPSNPGPGPAPPVPPAVAPPALPPPSLPPSVPPPTEATPPSPPADATPTAPEPVTAPLAPAHGGSAPAPPAWTVFDLGAGIIVTRTATFDLGDNPFQGSGEVGPAQEFAGPSLPLAETGADVAAAPAKRGGGADGATPLGARAHPMLSVPLPGTATTWLAASLALGVATGLFTGVATARMLVRRKTPTPQGAAAPGGTPARPPSLADLIRQVRQAPYDGQAHYQLGLSLMHVGEEERALSHLERSFVLYPQGVLELLTRPDLAPVRDHARVRHILRRFHRDQQRRLWTGYA